MQRMLKREGVHVYEGDLCCYDLRQVVGGEEYYIKKPTRFLTNSPFIGESLSLKCQGQHRHIELTGGGRTKRAEVYPDELCRAILTGLVKQMKHDDRIGSSFKSCDEIFNQDLQSNIEDTSINEVNFSNVETRDMQTLTWSRKDYGTSRLMLPGKDGPLWSSCTRRVTRDIDTDMIIEDRPADEVTGKERRREFRGGARNLITTFTYHVSYDTQPHQWECGSCKHLGWLKAPGTL